MVTDNGTTGMGTERVGDLLLELLSAQEHAEQLKAELRRLVGEERADRLVGSLRAPMVDEQPAEGTAMLPVKGTPRRAQAARVPTGATAGATTAPAPPTRASAQPSAPGEALTARIVALASADPRRGWTYAAFKEALGRPFGRAVLYHLVASDRLRRGKVPGEFYGLPAAK